MTTTTVLTPADVLREAADWFAEDPTRWGRDYFRNPADGCRCALGAVAQVLAPQDLGANPMELSTGNPEAGRLGRKTTAFLASYLIDYLDATEATSGNDEDEPMETDVVETVGDWNDVWNRTADDVISALRGAADEWDARQAARVARAS